MSDPIEKPESSPKAHDLKDAIRRVRLVSADQTDGMADLQAFERARLELLADSVADVFDDIPADIDYFCLAVSKGDVPRLWIDMTSHVAMGRDRRTYLFNKDTRLGRTLMRETTEREEMAAYITDYVAERIIERERALEGDWLAVRLKRQRAALAQSANPPASAPTIAAFDPLADVGMPRPPADISRTISTPANEDIPGAALRRRIPRPHRVVVTESRGISASVAFVLGVTIGIAGLFLAAWIQKNGWR